MKCSNCGSYIRDDSKFCNYCGIKLDGNPLDTERVSVPFSAETAEENPETNENEKNSAAENNIKEKNPTPEASKVRPRDENFNVQPKKPKETETVKAKPLSAGVIILIILVGIIAAVLANVIFYSMKNNQRTVINVETTNTSETQTEEPSSDL